MTRKDKAITILFVLFMLAVALTGKFVLGY